MVLGGVPGARRTYEFHPWSIWRICPVSICLSWETVLILKAWRTTRELSCKRIGKLEGGSLLIEMATETLTDGPRRYGWGEMKLTHFPMLPERAHL